MTRTEVLRKSFPTPVSVVRWFGRSRRRIWTLVLVLLVLLGGPPLWWKIQLVGLPDVGDPFDVAAFRASPIPEDRNAFVLYAEAAKTFKLTTGYFKNSRGAFDLLARWSSAVPEVRRWAEDNREALLIFRQGALRPDASDSSVGLDRDGLAVFDALAFFRMMTLLEASRLEDQGDMAGSWGWYHALSRTMRHLGMRASAGRRAQAQRWYRPLRDRVKTWSVDSRTTPALLRQALDDVVAIEALSPSEADSLKAGYLEIMWLLDRPENPGREPPLAALRRFQNPTYSLNPEQIQSFWDSWRSWRREPERSRRVIRLIAANWLAYYDLAVESRPKPDPNVAAFDVYPLGSSSPSRARALSPASLDRWYDSAYDAQKVIGSLNTAGARIMERANHVDLLMMLATELYRREHGADPPTPEALVGPYLKSLPIEMRSNEDDAAAPGVQ